jgi:hypothetical protein
MQADSYWECPRCGARNKRYAALCFGCGADTKAAARRAAHPPAPDRARMPRGAPVLLVAALFGAALLGFMLVRTFQSPALESAAASAEVPDSDTAREPVPPGATMPGAPDSGWPPPAALAPSSAPPPARSRPNTARSAVLAVDAPAGAYSEAQLNAIVATRGAGEATRDRRYVLALRQRRVDDLRARLARADSSDERAKLQPWLDAALADLERARR